MNGDTVVIEQQDETGDDQYLLRKLHKLAQGKYELIARNPDYDPVLTQAVGNDAQVFGKVRVADVLATHADLPFGEKRSAFNKIAYKHFDFVLCDKNDLSILCAIELDDSSHNSKKRRERDAFLVGACQAAGVSLVQFKAKAAYEIDSIRQTLKVLLPTADSLESELPPKAEIEAEQSSIYQKLCPKCTCAMAVKTASKGKNKGNTFWGCSGFPKCRYIESIEEQ
jgi:ssDNA-binding Zn-finger/Zn-ribbon topoisomerase 1